MIGRFFLRLAHVLLAAIVLVLDVAPCFIGLGLLYLFDLADRPNGHQTISGYIGKAAHNGWRWARLPQRLINAVLGDTHCYDAFLRGQG